ncbi:MAG: class I SAM-dependent methyltransferase [Chloroflexota bacterium]
MSDSHPFDAFVRYYDADYGTFTDDFFFYQELARRTDGPILELMCGSGRLLQPLLTSGHTVVGIDISSALLNLAQKKLNQLNTSQARVVQGDIRNALPHGPFALAIIAINSFMHLDSTTDQLQVLHNMYEVLRPGGLVVLDLFNPDPHELLRQSGQLVLDKTFTLSHDICVQKWVSQSVDFATQTSQVMFMYDEISQVGNVHRTMLPFTMRWLYRYELEHLLARAGFVVEQVYGSYDLEEYTTESELMLTVARKKKE